MCGIIGYIGKRKAQDVLLKGLTRLEYRGYDSTGIAVLKDSKIDLIKKKGKLKILIDELKKSPVEGDMGIGHCLTEDTLVHLADGSIVPISKVKNNQEVCAFNIKKQRVEPAKVRILRHKSPDYLYHLRTPFTTIKCTAHHKMFIASGGKIVEKMASDLKEGDKLLIPKNTKFEDRDIVFRPTYAKRYYEVTSEGNQIIKKKAEELQLTRSLCASLAGIGEGQIGHIFQNDRNVKEEELDRLLSTLSLEFDSHHFVPRDTIHGKFVTLPERSSADLMQIIGYLLGDGTVKERCIRFKDTDGELLGVYENLINRVFNLRGRIVPIRGTKAQLLEVNSLYLCQWLKENIICRKEEFLNQLGQLPKDEIAAFLKGIFDAEGCVHVRSGQISLRITDKHLVRISQLLLLKLGILTSFYTKKTKHDRWSDSYGIFLTNTYFFKIFISAIGFTSAVKKERLTTLISGRKSFGKYEASGDSSVFYQPILKIERIKSGEELLFDLEVEHPDASFIANGLVSHNSRWATHGVPNDINAHPHLDCSGKIAVVHNGIIENYQELKHALQKEGHKFISQTDTETIPHLIEKFYKGNLEDAVRKALKMLKGSYALVVLHRDEPEKLVGARCDSPLIVGVGDGENFLASDVPAILDYTKDVIYLDNYEVISITKDKVVVKDLSGRVIHKKALRVKWDISQAEKSGYDHFMMKEICEQADVLKNILDERLKGDKVIFEELKIEEAELKRVKKIAIVACGTAYHAGLTGKYMLEEYARLPCWVDTSSEFRYRDPLVGKDTLTIIVSQSGETADSLAALREARSRGSKVLGICNVLGSSIARESDGVIYTHAGPEIAVASTKAYTAQLAIFYLLTLYLGRLRNTIKPKEYAGLIKEFKRMPGLMADVIFEYKSEHNIVAAYAQEFKKYYLEKHNKSFFLYLARNINYPNALEGALKLKEIAYISAEGYPAGEMKHGPIALIDENPWVVFIATKSGTYDKILSNIQEIKARSGIIIAVATAGDSQIRQHKIDYLVEVPAVKEVFSPLLVVIPLQLLAYYVAKEFGYDIDQPRNLAKSVTVE